MKLLRKTIAIVLLCFACLLASSVAFYYWRVIGEFSKIENTIVKADANRVLEAIRAEQEQMRVTVIDWAQWDDMYNYMLEPNKEFEESWSTFESYKALRISDTIFLNLKREMVLGIHADFEGEAVQHIENGSPMVATLAATETFFQYEGEIPSNASFASVGGEIVIVSSSPILDSARSKAPVGYLLILKHVDSVFLEKIAKQTRLPIVTTKFGGGFDGENFLGAIFAADASGIAVVPIDDQKIHAYMAIRTPNGRPILPLRIQEDRPIYEQGWANLRLFVWFWAVASATIVTVAIFLLNRFIIARLAKVCLFLDRIGQNKDFTERLEPRGADELTDLSTDINEMLASLAEAHSDVVAAQLNAERANAAKSMFIARVSHELRTPVGGIVGINRIIKKKEGLSRAIRELVEMGDLTANGLLSIIDEILDFAKAESGELTFEKVPFDLRQIIRETMQTIGGRLEGKYKPEDTERVQLVCDIAPSVPYIVLGDPTKLRQILTNLLGNAVKFTQKGHIGLKIAVQEFAGTGASIRFEVSDTGLGIPSEKLHSIFEPFKQADSWTSRKFQGTGLGLSIVKQFAEGLSGNVSVTSESGAGSVFAVELPFGIMNEAAQISYQRMPSEPVLVAGDTPATAAILRNLSILSGASVVHIDPFANPLTARDLELIRDSDLLAISEDAIVLAPLWKAVEQRLLDATPEMANGTIAMLRPSNVELRDKLYSKQMRYVLPTPVLADDLLLAYRGELASTVNTAVVEDDGLKLDRKLKILVVDDMLTNRIFLEDMLGDAGHDVTCVNDGTDMVERLSKMINGDAADQYDIVLTDISMAIMNGDDATRAVRELERLSFNKIHIPILAVTAHAFQDEQEKILESGVDGVLVKPIQPNKVAEEFGRLLMHKA